MEKEHQPNLIAGIASRNYKVLLLITGIIIGIGLSQLRLELNIFSEIFVIAQQVITIFLGIYIEALPFLLMGVIASGLVEEFLDPDWLTAHQPDGRIGAIPGALLGLVVPVCECGIVPLSRRLMKKGLAPSAAIAFLLATPVANPIVLLSTWTATGSIRFVLTRAAGGLMIAGLIGFFFSFEKNSEKIIKPALSHVQPDHGTHPSCHSGTSSASFATRLKRSLRYGVDDFYDNNRFLVFGVLLAALLQIAVPQSFLLELATNPLRSHLVMIILAAVLSVCSTVDAFVAIAFMNTFSSGSIMAFLVFGPMVDIKAAALYLGTFTKKTVFYIIVLSTLLTLILAALIDLTGFL